MTGWAVLEALGVGIAALLLAWTALLYVPLRWWPVGRYLWIRKLAAAAFAPFIAAAGLLLALMGVRVAPGGWPYRPRSRRGGGHRGGALGLGAGRPDGRPRPRLGQPHPCPTSRGMVGRWWRGRAADHPEPRLRQDVVFATVPGSDRKLLCDVATPGRCAPFGAGGRLSARQRLVHAGQGLRRGRCSAT